MRTEKRIAKVAAGGNGGRRSGVGWLVSRRAGDAVGVAEVPDGFEDGLTEQRLRRHVALKARLGVVGKVVMMRAPEGIVAVRLWAEPAMWGRWLLAGDEGPCLKLGIVAPGKEEAAPEWLRGAVDGGLRVAVMAERADGKAGWGNPVVAWNGGEPRLWLYERWQWMADGLRFVNGFREYGAEYVGTAVDEKGRVNRTRPHGGPRQCHAEGCWSSSPGACRQGLKQGEYYSSVGDRPGELLAEMLGIGGKWD